MLFWINAHIQTNIQCPKYFWGKHLGVQQLNKKLPVHVPKQPQQQQPTPPLYKRGTIYQWNYMKLSDIKIKCAAKRNITLTTPCITVTNVIKYEIAKSNEMYNQVVVVQKNMKQKHIKSSTINSRVWITCGLNMHFTHPCWRCNQSSRKNGGCHDVNYWHFKIHSTQVSPRRCHFPLARGNCCPMPTLQHVQSPANCAHHRPPHGKNDANLPWLTIDADKGWNQNDWEKCFENNNTWQNYARKWWRITLRMPWFWFPESYKCCKQPFNTKICKTHNKSNGVKLKFQVTNLRSERKLYCRLGCGSELSWWGPWWWWWWRWRWWC